MLSGVVAMTVALATPRSHKTTAEFQRQHPCPVTQSTKGACPGYIKDHILPLCAGGPDVPSNVKWNDITTALLRDNQERALCRELKKHPDRSVCAIITADPGKYTLLGKDLCLL